MKVIRISTKGWTDIVDLTEKVQETLEKERIKHGVVSLFVIGSTAALTTIEDDENLFADLKETLEKIAPYKKEWRHHKTWKDDNGAAHIRASILGPGLTIPFVNGKLFLGTWQKVMLIDFDTKPREREVVVSLLKV